MPTRVPGGGWAKRWSVSRGASAREGSLKSPGKEVELWLAALHQEDREGPRGHGGPDPGRPQDAHRHVVGGHPQGGGPDRPPPEGRPAGGGGGGGGGGAG